MESMEAISGEWISLGEYYFNQDADFTAPQLFDYCSLSNELSSDSCFDLHNLLSNLDFTIDNVGTDNNATFSFDNVNANQILSPNSSCNLINYNTGMGELQPETIIREPEIQVAEETLEETPNNPSERSNKRPRNLCHVPKNKSRKNQRTLRDDKNDNATIQKQSSSNFCSEDESDGNKSKEYVALNSNGKRRAKSSATDPQSIYARNRRERINERLRVLQNLIPNGTKVDISTMLEEAVQYVKFLQLQIKLLSSDNMWMYAPIAYNGMNIELD